MFHNEPSLQKDKNIFSFYIIYKGFDQKYECSILRGSL